MRFIREIAEYIMHKTRREEILNVLQLTLMFETLSKDTTSINKVPENKAINK
jgi:hypothetical protein